MESAATDDGIRALDEEMTRAIARMYRRFRTERATGELGDAAIAVLAHLHRYGPQTLSALSDQERVTAGSMSQTVNRLTGLGYAERASDPSDRRRVLFELTATGHAVADAERARRHAWFRDRLAERSDDERAALRIAARVLAEIADA